LVVANHVKSQSLADTITLTTNFKGYIFMHKEQPIKAKKVMELMDNNDLAYDEFSESREAYFFGNLFAIIGSGLIVYPFLNSALGNEPNYGPAFAGVCFIAISVPIFKSYNKKTISAILQYNSDLAVPIDAEIQSSIQLGGTSSGIGLCYVF
jgi:hypothetical protein